MAIHVIDTNVVLRFLLADHAQHFERASKLMSEVQAGKRKAYLAESVLAESVFILTRYYKVPREEAAARLGELLDYKGFTGAPLPILKQALAIYATHKIDFVDAMVLATARHHGWHVETFDKALAKLAAGELRFERLKQEEALRAKIENFSAEDNLSRDEPHDRKS